MLKTFPWLPVSLREYLEVLKHQSFVIVYGIRDTWSQPFYLKIGLLFLAKISLSNFYFGEQQGKIRPCVSNL